MKESRTTMLISALIYTAIGVILILFPTLIGDTICYILGGGVIAIGIIKVIGYFITPAEIRSVEKPYTMISGIVTILIGGFIIIRSDLIISIIPFIIGVMIFISGIIAIQRSLNLKAMGVYNYKGSLIGAIIIAVFGLIMMSNPFQSAKLMSMVLGAGLVVSGLGDLLLQFRIKHYTKKD